MLDIFKFKNHRNERKLLLNLNAKFLTFRPQFVGKLWAIFEMQFELLQKNLTFFRLFQICSDGNQNLSKNILISKTFSLSQK